MKVENFRFLTLLPLMALMKKGEERKSFSSNNSVVEQLVVNNLVEISSFFPLFIFLSSRNEHVNFESHFDSL